MVVLGERASKANLELHDVMWFIGSKIDDNYDFLKTDCFGYKVIYALKV